MLIPAVIVGTHWLGIAGAGWAHLAVAAAGILPAYAFALRHVGVSPRVLAAALWPPLVAAVPSWLVAHAIVSAVDAPLPALLGGTAGTATYLAISYRRVRRLLPGRGTRRVVPDGPRLDQPSLEGVT